MASPTKIRVGIVGLGFGAEFIPIYQRHPNAEMSAICRRDRKELDACGDRFGVSKRYTDYAAMLADPDIDAVHINSPIADHAPQSIAALQRRQARREHGAGGDDGGRVPSDRRGAAGERQGLHDDGDRRLQPRVSLRERAVR